MPIKRGMCALLAALMVAAGAMHFLAPVAYTSAVPAYFHERPAIVIVSGLCEIGGGVGLLVPAIRRVAALSLAVLFVAVFPANLDMALHPSHWPHIPPLLLWLRLPLQIPLIAWAIWVSK